MPPRPKGELELLSWAMDELALGNYMVHDWDSGWTLEIEGNEDDEDTLADGLKSEEEILPVRLWGLGTLPGFGGEPPTGLRLLDTLVHSETIGDLLTDPELQDILSKLDLTPEEVVAEAQACPPGTKLRSLLVSADRRKWERARKLRERISEVIIQRETVTTPEVANDERIVESRVPKLLQQELIGVYCGEVARLFPAMVDRAARLRTLPVATAVPSEVKKYLNEATKCYLYGRLIACLVVCRAAIEYGVQEFLNRKGWWERYRDWVKENEEEESLYNRIRFARKFFGGRDLSVFWDWADEVRALAGRTLHPKPPQKAPQDSECIEAFDKTRKVLEALYQ